jgi:iron complex outermembrane receptor protein
VNAQGQGQSKKINGTVVSTTGEVLTGVTVSAEGTTNAAVTDMNGRFELQVSSNDKNLSVALIGMKKKTVPIGSGDNLRIELEEEAILLDEFVAVGYGNMQKKDLSGAITNITARDFNRGVVNSPEKLIAGKVAGLVITTPGGDPTQASSIRLRGTTSLVGGNAPLIVIDGVPDAAFNSVSPQDIESISILKDASSAAIYGARSANGIIMITTKKGEKGRTSISYDGYFGVESIAKNLDMLSADEWRAYVKENNIAVKDYGSSTAWHKETYQAGYSQNHNLSLMGGSENSSYRASVNFLDQKGIVKTNGLQRLSGNFAFEQYALDKTLRITMNANGTIENFRNVPTTDVFAFSYNLNPTAPVYNEDGSYFEENGMSNYNPVAMLNQMKRDNKRNIFNGRMQIEYKFLGMFTAAINGSYSRGSLLTGYYASKFSRAAKDIGKFGGIANRSNTTNDSKLFESTLTFDHIFSKVHKVNAIVGYSYQDFTNEYFFAQNRSFVSDLFEYNNLGAGNDLQAGDVSSNKNSNRLISFYGRANYSIDGKYILTATVRRDGSSKFGKDNKWGTFPSASVAWRISQENFMKGINFVDDLKLRVSYGITGNEAISSYRSAALYGTSGYYYDQGDYYVAYAPNQNENPNLKWEETAQLDFGIDYYLLKGRLRGSVDYYNKKTSNLLYTYPVPTPPYQYGTMMANVGEMENKGIEISVEGTIIDNKDWVWDVGVNFAKNSNKIISLSNDEFQRDIVYTGEWSLNGLQETPQILKPGYALGTFYGAKYIGKDENGIFLHDPGEDGVFKYADDRQVIGCAQPDFTMNFTNTVSYKNLSLSFMLKGVFGNDVVNSTRLYLEDINRIKGGNVLRSALDKVAQPLVYSSYYVEDGSFVRLEYITLSYDFKLKTNKIKNLRLFATANNLFTITGYSGIDPEVSADGLVFGLDARNYYPKTRSFSLGLNLSF